MERERSEGGDMLRAWTEMMNRMMTAPWASACGSLPGDAGRELRSAYLSAWTDFFERFLRTPEFLDSMRQSLSGGVDMRRQLNEFLGELRHTFQGPSRQDVDQIMLAIRHAQERVIDGLERIEARLDALEDRLGPEDGAAAKHGGSENGSSGERRRRQPPRRRGVRE